MSQVELTTALTRLVELAEFELLSPACPDPPLNFHSDLKEAAKVARRFLNELRTPAGDYFITADQPRRPGRARQLEGV